MDSASIIALVGVCIVGLGMLAAVMRGFNTLKTQMAVMVETQRLNQQANDARLKRFELLDTERHREMVRAVSSVGDGLKEIASMASDVENGRSGTRRAMPG